MESPFPEPIPDGLKLIETFGVRTGQGAPRLGLHLKRLATSAHAFGMPFDKAAAIQLVANLPQDTPLRCRMTLPADGVLDLETAPLPPSAARWVFRIHPTRLSSSDPWLAHKTTNRGLYDAARAALPEGVDEYLFLNELGEICEGTITNIAVTMPNGETLTPPLASGCLPGVFRQTQIESGAWRVATLSLVELGDAQAITFCNSLRGLIEAVWDLEDPARP